jgi:hypothetical protein
VHEVRPVTSGCRLVLLYNLIRQGPGRQPEAPNYGDETQTISALLQEWTEALREPEHVEPLKLIYPLEHAYTPAELSFQTLKGADAGIAEIVAAAARQAGCDVHLALVSIEENGTAVQTGGSSRYRRGRYDDNDDDDDEFEIVEMSDRAATASNWRRRDGEASPLTEIPIHEDEFSPAVLFEDLEPDEEHFQEATGNAGASYERTYSRTALILWPREQLLAVINQAGLVVTLPFLEDLVGRWSSSGDVSIRERARELSLHMIRDWDLDRWYAERSNNITPVGRFLDALRTLDDTPGLTAFLTRLANRPGFDPGDCAPTAAALRVIPAHEASILAARLIESAAKSALAPCAALLNNISAAEPTLAKAAARVLVAALPGDSERGPAITLWQRDLIPPPELIVDLFTALGRIDPTLAAVSADHILEWPATYDFDTVLIPAVLRLRDIPETAAQPAVQRLRDTCLAHLDARIALPLAAPVDWQRNDSVSCTCRDCHALAAYLRNASQQVWTFPAAEPRRRHVESTIQTSRCDVNTATQRRGSPHQLICTKNQASYERRRKQRIHDIDQRASLLAPDAQ